MNRDNDRQTSIILAVLGILPIVWLGLLIAPSVKGGLPEILPSLMNVMSDPFHIELCEDSVRARLHRGITETVQSKTGTAAIS